jgi:hypothetical protein
MGPISGTANPGCAACRSPHSPVLRVRVLTWAHCPAFWLEPAPPTPNLRPTASHQTTKIPPTPSSPSTSRVSIRIIQNGTDTLTVIRIRATIPYVSLSPARPGAPASSRKLCAPCVSAPSASGSLDFRSFRSQTLFPQDFTSISFQRF